MHIRTHAKHASDSAAYRTWIKVFNKWKKYQKYASKCPLVKLFTSDCHNSALVLEINSKKITQ